MYLDWWLICALQITAIDIDREAYEVGLPYIQKAGLENKIKFIQADAISVLNEMLNNVSFSISQAIELNLFVKRVSFWMLAYLIYILKFEHWKKEEIMRYFR
jgi:tRNA G37 N-methylase Trm5